MGPFTLFKKATGILFVAVSLFSSANAQPSYLSQISSEADFLSISVDASLRPEILRVSKFTAPSSSDTSLLPTVYQNVALYPLHYEFLIQVFPERFAGLTAGEYEALVLKRATREYYSGALFSITQENSVVAYGFETAVDPQDDSELLTAQETLAVYNQLAASFSLRPLVYAPTDSGAIALARTWENPGFPILFPGQQIEPEYEAYTHGTNYGRVRLMTLEELESGAESLSWQDILVLDEVPYELENVVAALITGERQAELSHVAIRMARRGTPNAYLAHPLEALAAYEGQLVRLEVNAGSYSISVETDETAAEEWWDAHRPVVTSVPFPNYNYTNLDQLSEMDVTEASGSLIAKVGGKAANLARMYAYLPPENQVSGLAIPFHYYQQFMTSNEWVDTSVVPSVTYTYEEYLESLLTDDQFQNDSSYRLNKLAAFRDEIEDHGVVSSTLVGALAARIEEVFGSAHIMVRFRSSSNAEDSLVFTGAGLYDSTSVCVEDSLDANSTGPSHCDPNQEKERTIERGLKKVWASLWNYRAYEERDYYQIPQDRVAMAILVTTAFPDEAANGVAFTGDTILGATAGYLINVQIGDYSVVQPDTGVLPERDILTMASGEVTAINRARGSSLLEAGKYVLSDDQLRTLGHAMALVDANQPIDLEGYDRGQVLLDIEFKFTQAGALILKQVRPFLLSSAGVPQASDYYQLVIPEGTTLCRRFFHSNSLKETYDTLIQVTLKPGRYYLPKEGDDFEINLIQEILYGPFQQKAEALEVGKVSINKDFTYYAQYTYYDFEQSFEIGDATLEMNAGSFYFAPENPLLELDNNDLIWYPAFFVSIADYDEIRLYRCSLEGLSQITYEVQLAEEFFAKFVTAWLPGMIHMATVADVIHGEVTYPGGGQSSDDYRDVLYTNTGYLNGILGYILQPPFESKPVFSLSRKRSHYSYSNHFEASFLDINFQELEKPDLKMISVYLDSLLVTINEVMIANDVLPDESNEYEPWLEVINNTTEEVHLEDYTLTHIASTTSSWTFPTGTLLGGGECLVVWLDGETGEGRLHTSFKVDSMEGVIILTSHLTGLCNPPPQTFYYYENPPSGKSEGRLPDGTGQYYVLDNPTPGKSNKDGNPVFVQDWMQY